MITGLDLSSLGGKRRSAAVQSIGQYGAEARFSPAQ